MDAPQHHAALYSAKGQHWCHCLCGWKSRIYGSSTGAHLEFGRHLVEIEESK